jgi:hypothetical protein
MPPLLGVGVAVCSLAAVGVGVAVLVGRGGARPTNAAYCRVVAPDGVALSMTARIPLRGPTPSSST